jgi:predicted dehydrogenase
MTPRIGLVGCGRWGRNILRDLVALGARVEVVTLGATQADARALGAAAVHDGLAALPPQDGYVVAVPTATHAAVVEALLPRGRPIFCEKPLTPSAAETRRLAGRADGQVFVMHKWRYHPGVVALAGLLGAGTLGRPLALQVRQFGWGHAHGDVDAATILLPHALSIALHLLGALPPLRLAQRTIPGRPDGGLLALLGRPDEAPPQVLLEYGVVQPDHRRGVLLVGSAATAQLGGSYDEALLLRLGPPGAPAAERRLPFAARLPLECELETFLAHLAGGPPPLSPLADELAVAERLDDIRRAAELSPP